MILNAVTQDSVADALDRCMLGDLCERPLCRSPGANIDCLFLQAQGNREAAISLFLGLR